MGTCVRPRLAKNCLLTLVKYCIRWASYQFKFKPPVISNLALLMLFYSATEFSILCSLNVLNRFTPTIDRVNLPKKNISFRKELIFLLVGTLISKSGIFRAHKIHTWSYRSQCSHYDWLFVAALGAKAQLANIYLKMKTKQP